VSIVAKPVADIDFGSPEFLRDPWTPLRALQQDQPIFWSPSQRAWIVTRHEDVLTTFRDPRLSASRIVPFLETIPGGLGDDFPLIRQFEDKWISNVDQPVHSRLRRLMTSAFSKAVVEGLRPESRRISRDILDEVAGREVDYVVDVARELPARVICAMFGIPPGLRDRFATWAGHIQQATGAAVLSRAMIELYHQTLVDMNVELVKLIAARRAAPQDDLLTQFVLARDESDKLSDDELLGACHATIIAGFETTMHMLTLGMIELHQAPALRDHLLAGREETGKTVDELLRYIGMAKGMLRVAREDFAWHGQRIRKGDFVFGMNIAANRDERAWRDPDRIDPERNNARSMAFGPGMHFCLGHLLAKMELGEFFNELFGCFEIEILSEERPWINSFTFRGLEHLPVRITRKVDSSSP
jgi:cytochrome P450